MVHIIIPRVSYARLICSRQHRSYLLVPGVLEVPGDPLFHLYRPYLKKNKNMLELSYFKANEKLATKTSNLFFQYFCKSSYKSYVEQLPPTFKICFATKQADSWVVISCPKKLLRRPDGRFNSGFKTKWLLTLFVESLHEN